ncbi:MAG TPA: hypothetical protein VMX18_03465 [Candidatus Bipolaricaulota bacterium]|nr:hypothetical protein [Candidatus Bipolaricaulota bacterium]
MSGNTTPETGADQSTRDEETWHSRVFHQWVGQANGRLVGYPAAFISEVIGDNPCFSDAAATGSSVANACMAAMSVDYSDELGRGGALWLRRQPARIWKQLLGFSEHHRQGVDETFLAMVMWLFDPESDRAHDNAFEWLWDIHPYFSCGMHMTGRLSSDFDNQIEETAQSWPADTRRWTRWATEKYPLAFQNLGGFIKRGDLISAPIQE